MGCNVMKCEKCGRKIKKNYKLCPNCGQKIKYVGKKVKSKIIKNKQILLFISLFIVLLLLIIMFLIIDHNRKDVSNLKKSVVLIHNYDKNGELISLGSGVAVFKNNIIVTNAHVIEKNYRLEIISEDNEKYNISGLLYYNKRKDIAIIKLSNAKSLKALRITKKIKTGEPVTAIGSPLGLKNTVSTGVISGSTYDEKKEVYQHSAPISPGSSGGALINSSGKLIGINCETLEGGQNLNFAIPIKNIEKEYQKVKHNKTINTKYYKLLNNSVYRTNAGSQILRYALTDEFSNTNNKLPVFYMVKRSDYNPNNVEKYKNEIIDVLKKGELETCYGRDCYDLSNYEEADYNYINHNTSDYIYISSGYSAFPVEISSDESFEFDNCLISKQIEYKYLNEPNYYTIHIFKLKKSSNSVNLKKIIKNSYSKTYNENEDFRNTEIIDHIDELKIDDDLYIESGKKYMYALHCQNYKKCSKVKKILDEFIK